MPIVACPPSADTSHRLSQVVKGQRPFPGSYADPVRMTYWGGGATAMRKNQAHARKRTRGSQAAGSRMMAKTRRMAHLQRPSFPRPNGQGQQAARAGGGAAPVPGE